MIEPNAPPAWVHWGEWFWLAIFIVGGVLEIYSAFINPHVPTFTGMIKRFIPWPFVRAVTLGALFVGLMYHFFIQPLYEVAAKMGIKVF